MEQVKQFRLENGLRHWIINFILIMQAEEFEGEFDEQNEEVQQGSLQISSNLDSLLAPLKPH